MDLESLGVEELGPHSNIAGINPVPLAPNRLLTASSFFVNLPSGAVPLNLLVQTCRSGVMLLQELVEVG